MSDAPKKPAIFSKCNAGDLKEWLAQGNGDCLLEGTPSEIRKRNVPQEKKLNLLSDQPILTKKVTMAKKKKLSMIEK